MAPISQPGVAHWRRCVRSQSRDDLGGLQRLLRRPRDVEIDFILYFTYDAQVEANLSGAMDVAWNSPLAWVKSQIVSGGALSRDCHARFGPRPDHEDPCRRRFQTGFSCRFQGQDPRGGRLGFAAGDADSTGLIADAGIDPRSDCRVLYNEVMVGKHGDHVGGERDAAKALAGAADAACVLDANYPVFINEGTLDPGTTACWPRRLLSITATLRCAPTCQLHGVQHFIQPFIDTLLGCLFRIRRFASSWNSKGSSSWLPGAHDRLRAARESGAADSISMAQPLQRPVTEDPFSRHSAMANSTPKQHLDHGRPGDFTTEPRCSFAVPSRNCARAIGSKFAEMLHSSPSSWRLGAARKVSPATESWVLPESTVFNRPVLRRQSPRLACRSPKQPIRCGASPRAARASKPADPISVSPFARNATSGQGN